MHEYSKRSSDLNGGVNGHMMWLHVIATNHTIMSCIQHVISHNTKVKTEYITQYMSSNNYVKEHKFMLTVFVYYIANYR